MKKTKWIYMIWDKNNDRPVYIGESVNPMARWYSNTKKLDLSRDTHELRYIEEFDDRRDALTKERELKLFYGLEHTEGTRAHHLSKPKPLLVFKDGKLIGEYYAIQQAVRTLKLTKCDVYHCLAGRTKTHRGYTYQYR